MTEKVRLTLVEMKFLLTCLLRGMTEGSREERTVKGVSTHMPLARHDRYADNVISESQVSTHMPLARHDARLVILCTG